ncbi:hypothetical protein [Streptococcus mutans]|uniref:hypothetical protein n=1 Tax=Streptococcus mutans TaxID=1309 RepID=UPI000B5433F7|nr:hypothetical protein [Streptococcus mutans]
MTKKHFLALQVLLLIWFFLDMIGLSVGKHYLVTQSYHEDGIFFLIYLFTVLLFVINDNIGKWLVATCVFLWGIVQFLSHEWYTFFNSGFMRTTAGTMRYISNIYPTILYLLIVLVLIRSIFISYSLKIKIIGR